MAHFFETDLPLPLARKLHLGKLLPPAEVRRVREQVATFIEDLGGCRLSPAERAQLPVTPVAAADEWHLDRRASLTEAAAKLAGARPARQVLEQCAQAVSAARRG